MRLMLVALGVGSAMVAVGVMRQGPPLVALGVLLLVPTGGGLNSEHREERYTRSCSDR